MRNVLNVRGAQIASLLFGATLLGGGHAKADQVIADDLIVQGSLCVGFDCVNNESFGFTSIRLKENNVRIDFDDDSTSAGFAANDWRLEANSSASGGANYLAIKDMGATGGDTGNEGGTALITATAGAPANSIFIASTGKVGFQTATPLLDIHINTTNTPAIRLEQNSGGGFTAQTWDVGANEANFFVRDLTGGSRLPLRIRPGAPTSSIDISAAGNVGVGTASPTERLHVVSTSASVNPLSISNTAATGYAQVVYRGTGRVWGAGVGNASEAALGLANKFYVLDSGSAPRLVIDTAGNVGIGTTGPAAQLHTTGSVRFAGVANCSAGIVSNAAGTLSCAVSSARFKDIRGALAPETALANMMALRPQVGSYKDTPDVPEHWLIAEDVAAVDPALAGFRGGEPYTVKTQNVVADLVAVIQGQQRRIEALERAVAAR